MADIPDRGDLIVLNFNPQTGHEQAGRRNAIVLSPKPFNKATGFIVVCPITNKQKGYPFEVSLPVGGISLGNEGYPVEGVILTDQIKYLDWTARNFRILKKYNQDSPEDSYMTEVIEECLAKIYTYLT